MTILKRSSALSKENMLVLLAKERSNLAKFGVEPAQLETIRAGFAQERKTITLRCTDRVLVVIPNTFKGTAAQVNEAIRRSGAALISFFNDEKISNVTIADAEDKAEQLLALAEGIALSNYQFLNYKVTDKAKETNALKEVEIFSKTVKENTLERLRIIVRATTIARDLVNEPVSTLDAVKLSEEYRKLGKDAGFRVEVLSKSKIEALKMGGLLGVNKGSETPPTFTIMEYKPARPKNKKPVVLVGKGVVFDTGGYNIKTGAGMETMKCDMAGAAAVGAAIWAIAKAKLPVHVIALAPATDNRINSNAIVPGDILRMYSGLTVEMLNSDAEGRLILADALAYSERFDPSLVLEFSTLTGASVAAIGQYGLVCMGTAGEREKNKLKSSGFRVHERLAEFPFWDEYDELIKSDIAEIKNIGGPYGGSITAGKFLAHFVKAPFMHFDIAGPAFIAAKDAYRTKGGTGVGVRLLFDYFSTY